ncbi:hypothetical protein ACFQYP_63910 [Nonomuraea antimicrobica]
MLKQHRRALAWLVGLACIAGAVVALFDIETPLRPFLISVSSGRSWGGGGGTVA